jgi:SET domain-containing protein
MVGEMIKPSKIHGLGLFASREIKKGERVNQGKADYDNYRDEWREYIHKTKTPSCNFVWKTCMINHADVPNTNRGKHFNVYANRLIKQGEEITEDYNKLPVLQNPFKTNGMEQILFESLYYKRKHYVNQ